MSVLIETSLGPLTVDLFAEAGDAPSTSANFLQLCKAKKYNGCLFFNVEAGFVAQTGDPTGTGRGGTAFAGLAPTGSAAADGAAAPAARFQADEIRPHLKHSKKGTVSFVRTVPGVPDTVGSQFVITLRDNVTSLDGVNSVCGEIVDGMETLDAIGSAFVDGDGRPYVDIRILHTHVLLDPFPDPPELEAVMPPGGASPAEGPPPEEVRVLRLLVSRCCCCYYQMRTLPLPAASVCSAPRVVITLTPLLPSVSLLSLNGFSCRLCPAACRPRKLPRPPPQPRTRPRRRRWRPPLPRRRRAPRPWCWR